MIDDGAVIVSRRDVRVGPHKGRGELTFSDPDHSAEEDREVTIGTSARQRVLFVAHTERGNHIRIISARLTTRREQEQYEEGSGEATQ